MFEKRRLYAKSFSGEKSDVASATLRDRLKGAAKFTGHISLVMQAADLLLERLGRDILQQLGLQGIDFEYFANTVRLGAYLHDWGKANEHFQEMVYFNSIDANSENKKKRELRKEIGKQLNLRKQRQMLRHEMISGILALQVPSFREWLERCPNANLTIAVWGALGHHLKAGVGKDKLPLGDSLAKLTDDTGSELKIYTRHDDFKALLRMGKAIGLPTAEKDLPELPEEIWSKDKLKEALKALWRDFRDIELDEKQRKLTAAVKATVIAADLAGSALPQEEENFTEWMGEVLSLQLSTAELKLLVDNRLGGKPLRPFQERVAESRRRVTVVKAGCGSGKTVAAYEWAKRHAVGRKLFFCYPTTGTASQGFIDYAHDNDFEAALMHSRADLDRELLFSGEGNSGEGNSGEGGDAEGTDARLAAFQAWRQKLVVCTVDAVLGLMQNNRRPLYAWPAIANAAFVFDEVHAYDKQLFGAFLQFLRTFQGAPILLMSASFTPTQLEAIKTEINAIGEEIDAPIEGPQELEELPRYQIEEREELEVWEPVINALQNRKKVLWVTNSVQNCIDLYREAKIKLNSELPEIKIELLIYHSRFRYKDRVEKHKAVIEAFEKRDTPVLAITTQVCEMSLDISADLLISAMAPAAALIQRLGRLNRRMTKSEDGARLAIIYPSQKSQKVYSKEPLETGKQLLAEAVTKKVISQKDLAEIATKLNSYIPELVNCVWLTGDWETYPGFLREGGYTMTVLLEEDLGEIGEEAKRKNKSFMEVAQGYSVSIRIPKKHNWREWKRKKFYPVAPPKAVFYSQETGAEEQKCD